jgi:hypothetical protein
MMRLWPFLAGFGLVFGEKSRVFAVFLEGNGRNCEFFGCFWLFFAWFFESFVVSIE